MKGNYTISGPGVHETRQSAKLGLSFAINLASHAAKNRIETSYYVRDKAETVVGRTDAFTDGSVSIFGPEQLGVAA